MCGCLAKVGISELKRNKIEPKLVDAILVRYALNSNMNRFLGVNSKVSKISNNTLIESRDVYFKDIFPFKSRITNQPSVPSFEHDIPNSSNSIEPKPEPEVKPRHNKRVRKEELGEGFFTFLVEEPSTFAKDMSSIDAHFWKEAINNEFE